MMNNDAKSSNTEVAFIKAKVPRSTIKLNLDSVVTAIVNGDHKKILKGKKWALTIPIISYSLRKIKSTQNDKQVN